MTKTILGRYSTDRSHWFGDGFPVRSLFSYSQLGGHISPFLLLDYAGPHYFEPKTDRRVVGDHPHRGFETVTIVYDGEVEHRDSTDSGGIINLPHGRGTVRIIAGNLFGTQGPAKTFSPINMWDVKLIRDADLTLPLPEGHTAMLVVLSGHVTVNGTQDAGTAGMVLLRRDGGNIALHADGDATLLALTGEPIDEPIFGHGPVVMNTEKEIRQAFDDYNSGRFTRAAA